MLRDTPAAFATSPIVGMLLFSFEPIRRILTASGADTAPFLCGRTRLLRRIRRGPGLIGASGEGYGNRTGSTMQAAIRARTFPLMTTGSVWRHHHPDPGPIQRPGCPLPGRPPPARPTEVRIEGGLWGRMQELNAVAVIDHCLAWMERIGWVANFDRIAGTCIRRPRGHRVRGLRGVQAARGDGLGGRASDDAALARRFDELVAAVGAAQDPDGYLNTSFGHAGRARPATRTSSGATS